MKNYSYLITPKTGQVQIIKADTLNQAIEKSGHTKTTIKEVTLILDRFAA